MFDIYFLSLRKLIKSFAKSLIKYYNDHKNVDSWSENKNNLKFDELMK